MSMENVPRKVSVVQSLMHKFDNLAMREQKLLMIAVPISILLLVFLGVVEADIKSGSKLKANAGNVEKQLRLNQETNNQLMAQLNEDPNLTIKQQIEGLKQRLERLDNEFASEMAQLVSPQAMPIMLEALLSKANNLELIEMASQEPSMLKILANENKSNDYQQPIFKHTLHLKLEGDFFATRKFLSEAEQIGWKIYWQDMSYQVIEHPKASIELSLFTLSTSEAFIGVN